MRYRCFNGEQGELKKRIESEERKHFTISLDLKIAKHIEDDARIAPLEEKLQEIEVTLSALHDQLE